MYTIRLKDLGIQKLEFVVKTQRLVLKRCYFFFVHHKLKIMQSFLFALVNLQKNFKKLNILGGIGQ